MGVGGFQTTSEMGSLVPISLVILGLELPISLLHQVCIAMTREEEGSGVMPMYTCI